MIKPIMPENESNRLKALQSYQILDTLPEEEYNEITKLAAIICNTPISQISLIDKKRQFIKAAFGLEIQESDRDIAFCSHSILNPADVMIVTDSRNDERFHDNPFVVEEPKIIFYAGMPLVSSDGYSLGALCVIDHVPRKLSAKQLEALNYLSRQTIKLFELRKANAVLKVSQKRLKAYSEQMESFAYMASHDLKEPARMVNNFMQLLEKKYATQLDEKAKKYIYFASDGAKRMMVLIDDLLAFAKVNNETNTNEEVNTNQLLNEVTAYLKGVIEEKNANIVYGELPVIFASATGIKILFRNLISNALKYQSADKQSFVEISYKETNTYWQFVVQDNGIGIDSKNLETVFQMFKRLHNKEAYTGTGLGLAICKKIVENHGGNIWVESEEGKGSKFYFTISKI